jgi:hypothetical protein
MTDEERIQRFKDAAAELSEAMQRRGLLEGEGEDEPARVGLFENALLGQFVAFEIGELLYTLAGDELVVTRQHAGRTEWAYVDENGELGARARAWRMEAPPRPQSN